MEEWRDVIGYEGLYQVSNQGRVRNINTNKLMKIRIKKDKYAHLGLVKNKKQKDKIVSRLVAQSFIPNPENKPQVNHKNLIRDDNRLNNLEWVTARENIIHGIINGHGGTVKLNPSQVIEIRELYETGNYTHRSLAPLFNITHQQICEIVNHKDWIYI